MLSTPLHNEKSLIEDRSFIAGHLFGALLNELEISIVKSLKSYRLFLLSSLHPGLVPGGVLESNHPNTSSTFQCAQPLMRLNLGIQFGLCERY